LKNKKNAYLYSVKEVVFFSNNKNKIIEIKQLFLNSPTQILSLNDFIELKSPEETGSTFEENAKIKSIYGLKKLNKICFADDSGICIEAIDNKPGINSKDFLKKREDRFSMLKEIIYSVKIRKKFNAFFQTSISLSLKKNKNIIFTGIIKGTIANKITGLNGFGYDPIFIPNGHKRTFAEMSINEKNKISHRAIAIDKLKKYLSSIV